MEEYMLFGWMKSLIIYLIFAGAIINLSPSGNYKKYIKFFTGILAIIILMKPISYVFSLDEAKLNFDIGNMEVNEDSKLNQPESKDMMDYYDLSISEGIRLMLEDRGFAIEAVSVITHKDNSLLSCRVQIDLSSELNKDFEENEIKKYINEVYNLSINNIYVVRR